MNYNSYTAIELQKMGICIIVGKSEFAFKPGDVINYSLIPRIDQRMIEHFESLGFVETHDTKAVDRYNALHGEEL